MKFWGFSKHFEKENQPNVNFFGVLTGVKVGRLSGARGWLVNLLAGSRANECQPLFTTHKNQAHPL
jgi:hypothetical protein